MLTLHISRFLACFLMICGAELRGRNIESVSNDDGTTLRIERFDPPLIIYEAQLEAGRRKPDWFGALTTFHWPNHLEGYREMLEIMTPAVADTPFMTPEKFAIAQADPTSWGFYQTELHLHRAIYFRDQNGSYVVIEENWVDEARKSPASDLMGPLTFVETASGWKYLYSPHPTWLDYVIQHQDEELLKMMEAGTIPGFDMSIQDTILSEGVDVVYADGQDAGSAFPTGQRTFRRRPIPSAQRGTMLQKIPPPKLRGTPPFAAVWLRHLLPDCLSQWLAASSSSGRDRQIPGMSRKGEILHHSGEPCGYA